MLDILNSLSFEEKFGYIAFIGVLSFLTILALIVSNYLKRLTYNDPTNSSASEQS